VRRILQNQTKVMTLPKACAYLGERTGKTPATSTAWRWVLRGVRGGIKLEVLRIGGTTYTTPEMIEQFIARTSASASPSTAESSRHDPASIAVDHEARRHEIANAQSRLRELCTPKRRSRRGPDAATAPRE